MNREQAEVALTSIPLYKPVQLDNEDARSVWLNAYAHQLNGYKQRRIGLWGNTCQEAIVARGLTSEAACDKARRDAFQMSSNKQWSRLGAWSRRSEEDQKEMCIYLQSLDYAIARCRCGVRCSAKAISLCFIKAFINRRISGFAGCDHSCRNLYYSMNREYPSSQNRAAFGYTQAEEDRQSI